MPNILGDFEKKKKYLLHLFDQLVELKFVPCKLGETSITQNDIACYKKDLVDERFVISVCGQINAGKSTLLNYLLFNGKDIIPTDDTPWTAKLTDFRYGVKDGVRITFYSEKEWQKLKSLSVHDETTGKSENYFAKFLQTYVDRAAKNGIFDKEVIRSNARVFSTEELDISNYVSKDGIYTPFVSKVEVTLHNDLLRDIIMVDTPGLNDPNELRSQVTKEWIKHSNAIIMIFYAGRPFEKSDLDFIDTYLIFVPTEKHVFALSKIDTQDGYERAQDYIEHNLRTNKQLKDRHFLGNSKIHPISTISAIIKHKIENGIELTEDEEYYHNRIKKESPELIEHGGYLKEFLQGIEKNLMQDKGKSLIRNAEKKVHSTCLSKIGELEFDLLPSDTDRRIHRWRSAA